ncbi:hypothetical protein [Micromonospora inositola]|uniref:hypothetical protein n=1 Tax=Micromonospora inositola TaxID=47865 RepID=UPI0012FD9544|nr:hypothetical protein [Micromonospora inositola]
MIDEFSARYADLVTGSYDCVDRIVLNAYYPLGHGPGGIRTWWRRLHGSDDQLDDTHLMRMAGRLARRVKAWGAAHGVPVIFCKAGERKHRIAEQYLATHELTGPGVFLVLVAKAPATVWKVKRSASGVITNLEKKSEYVNHYSFHIMDPDWGHVTIKMSGHPPFGAQVILNGHEYVACQARRAGIASGKDGNCFTMVADPAGLARVADALSQDAAVGAWARSATGGSTPRACASLLTPTNNADPASATPTRSTRWSTAVICCSAPARGCSTCSTGWSTAPAPAWTCPRYAPSSAPRTAPTVWGSKTLSPVVSWTSMLLVRTR